MQVFFIECAELLQEMEARLMGLEADPEPVESINAIFRVAHTIKGSAGLFGLTEVVDFAHVFNVKRNDDGEQWLNTNWTNPENQWNLDNRIVFRLRKSLHFSPAPRGGVLFYNLSIPPSEHFADFRDFF